MVIRFQVDPDFYDHPKSIGMSDAATALWVRAGSYSAAKLTDGFIAEHVLATLSRVPEEAADELMRRGLWRRVRGGYRFHQWEARNLTKARVEDDRAADRERKKRARNGTRKPSTQAVGNQPNDGSPQVNGKNVRPDSERTPNGFRRDSERIPGASVSVSVSESVSGSGRPADAPPRTCPEHAGDPDPPPCGRCADARRNHDRWERAWALAEAERVRNAPRCRNHRGQPAHNCGPCRSEALVAQEEPT